jgi:hypothetical protein
MKHDLPALSCSHIRNGSCYFTAVTRHNNSFVLKFLYKCITEDILNYILVFQPRHQLVNQCISSR